VRPRVILAGGAGLIGQTLQKHFAGRYEIIVLTRSPRMNALAQEVMWDGDTLASWSDLLEGAHAVINLTGQSVSCRYTEEARREIIESRVNSVHVLGEAVEQARVPPRVWIQASSLAIYGDAGERICDESAPAGEGFPVETCQLWEKAFAEIGLPSTRKVVLRIGFVLSRDGGVLSPLSGLARCGLGGAAGNGRQYISWLHKSDLNRMFDFVLEHEAASGVYNATAPEAVPNKEFMRELRHVLGSPWSPPVPGFLVRIGAFFMGTEGDLALTGRRCIPKRFIDEGFTFEFPELSGALENLYW
jgi:uncharacterized protein (TIGR01777 family)